MVCKSLELVALKGKRLTVVMREESAGRKLSSLVLHGTRVWVIEKRPLGRGTRKAVPCTKKETALQLHTEVRVFFTPEWRSVRIATRGEEMGTVGRSAMGAKVRELRAVGGVLTVCQTADQTLAKQSCLTQDESPFFQSPDPGGRLAGLAGLIYAPLHSL